MEPLVRWRRTRKDYSQVVEFPVEIVGRDGQIRRFSFDESVRLYQRRILSAALRYENPADVLAEREHCRQRVEQLRRSYLEHCGWGPFRTPVTHGSVLGTPFAAEVVSFLRRVFGEEPEGIASMLVTPLESGLTDTCFVQTSGRAFLLYAWRMDLPAAREASSIVIKRLNEAPSGEGVERLLERWVSPDILVILTGTGPWSEPRVTEEMVVPPTGDVWLDGMRALYDGQIAVALGRLEQGMEVQPARKVLSQTASLIALMDGQAERGGFDARAGLVYHPSDPLLRYCDALAWCRQARFGEVEARLREVRSEEKPMQLLQVLLALRGGEIGKGFQLWRRLGQGTAAPRFVGRASWMIAAWLGQVLVHVVLALGLAAAATWALAVQGDTAVGIGLLVGGLLLLLPLERLTVGRAERALLGRNSSVLLVSPELFPRERRGESAN